MVSIVTMLGGFSAHAAFAGFRGGPYPSGHLCIDFSLQIDFCFFLSQAMFLPVYPVVNWRIVVSIIFATQSSAIIPHNVGPA